MRAELEAIAWLVREAVSEFESVSGARDPPWSSRTRITDLVTDASLRLATIGESNPRARRAQEHLKRAREQLAEAFDGRRDGAALMVHAKLSEALAIIDELLSENPTE